MACKKRWAEKAERWGNSKNQKEILERESRARIAAENIQNQGLCEFTECKLLWK